MIKPVIYGHRQESEREDESEGIMPSDGSQSNTENQETSEIENSETRRRPTPKAFTRLNALYDNGWLGFLTGAETAVWIAHHRCANAHGICNPKPITIASHIGHSGSDTITKLRTRLVSYGLLRIVDPGGGDKHATIEVLVPGHVPTGGQIRPRCDSHTGVRIAPPTGVRIAPPTGVQIAQPLNIDEQTIEQTIEQTPRCAGDALDKTSGEGFSPHVEFKTWWMEEWSHSHHGEKYPFKRADGVAAAQVVKHVEGDVEKAKGAARIFFEKPQEYGAEGHRLTVFNQRIAGMLAELAARKAGTTTIPKPQKGKTNGKFNGDLGNRIQEHLRL
jgi:hypothetical protein